MSPLIPRPAPLLAIRNALERAPIAALLGPRQCGKTTLAHQIAGEGAHFFDLERSADRQALVAAPERTLSALRGLIVLDEMQMLPELFPVLRVLADRPAAPARFLILGSASPDLVRGASETLAGRVAFVFLSGFDIAETRSSGGKTVWLRVQVRRRAGHEQIHARGDRRLEARAAVRGLPRRSPVRARRED